MGQKRRVWWLVVLFVGGATVCGLAGLISGLTAAGRMGRLEPVTAPELAASQPGDEVLIEGRISDENPARFRDYVAYVRETRDVENWEGTPDPGSWSEVERVTPPLWIALEDTLVWVVNDDYDLDVATAVEERTTLDDYASTRYRGLAAGDDVLVVGQVTANRERPEIEADLVAEGTQERYITRQRSGGILFCVGSGIVAALGGAFLLWDRIGALLARRRR